MNRHEVGCTSILEGKKRKGGSYKRCIEGEIGRKGGRGEKKRDRGIEAACSCTHSVLERKLKGKGL